MSVLWENLQCKKEPDQRGRLWRIGQEILAMYVLIYIINNRKQYIFKKVL